MKKRFLLGIIIFLVFILGFTGCQRISQEDVDRQLSRWWVIYYKMQEDATSNQLGQMNELTSEADEALRQEFNPKGEHFSEHYDSASIKDKYRLVKRRNELWEEVLVKLKGDRALKEIEDIWSLDEVPDLWEKVNKESEEAN